MFSANMQKTFACRQLQQAQIECRTDTCAFWPAAHNIIVGAAALEYLLCALLECNFDMLCGAAGI